MFEEKPGSDYRHRQHTLAREMTCIGIGLHSGRPVVMIVRPADVNTGIVFIRRDVGVAEQVIPARWYHVGDTDLSTSLRNRHGVTVSTVEHLLAALRGCGIDNAFVELDGPEVPIMDGSAVAFVRMIEGVGRKVQNARRFVIWVHRSVYVQDGDKVAALMPGASGRITVSIDFPSGSIGAQTLSVEVTGGAFARELAGARTFGFESQIEILRQRGLARGGSMRNAILVGENGILNPEGLRCPDEFVRHKALDCFGDLTLAGVPVMGHFYGHKPGHALNHALLQELFSQPDAWTYIPADEFEAIWSGDGGGQVIETNGGKELSLPRRQVDGN
jgi:UDP-3-O-[3-hydroxymyristoyl] N-acetylglucosamine deacetylase